MQLQQTRTLRNTFDVDMPLHPETRSCEDVASLVERFLRSIDAHRRDSRDLAPGDVLQALSIVTAVQMAKGEATERYGSGLQIELRGLSVEAATARI
ncbi:hypothetical protein [Thiocapsa roseopersicina]|uniref:Uncharacterized protein n=1 Tax=Thiocapsa roseopersicina TaxID=1058 RepID=A0A1H2YY15_THIRO|nr:hypothetical protein [Thiocapsa roseopersicina]SDX09967.1 hypothetical protein SAMN05421783_11428 [Thiocapsa roseopersicina]